MRGRLGDALGSLAGALRDVRMRRVQLAWSGMITAEWAIIIALGVWAFEAGGALGVGLMTVARTLPAAVMGPLLAPIADRHRRDHVLGAVSVVRTVLVAAVAIALVGSAPTAVVYVLAALDASAYTLYWPAQSSLLTELARRPEELVAANVASTTIENVGGLGGPVLAAAALGFTTAGPTVGLAAVLLAVAGLALVPLARSDRPAPASAADEEEHSGLLAGFRYLAKERRSRIVAGLYLSHTLAFGGLTVLIVVLALDGLQLGESGVGLLTAGMGAGGVVGSIAALGLVGNPRLGTALATGVLAWAIATGMLGLAGAAVLAVGLLVLGGICNALVDVAALTLLQRLVPEGVLGRVLGVVEGAWWATLGVGGLGASLLAEWLGVRTALGVVGVALAGVTLAVRAAMRSVDTAATVPRDVVAVLLRDPIIGPLPTPQLECLALNAVALDVAAGGVVLREGDPGDHYFILRTGEVEVTRTDLRRRLGPGEGFGEIALLHAVPRTATVTAVQPTALLRIDRESFLHALRGHATSAAVASAIATERLRGAPSSERVGNSEATTAATEEP
jgi:MFS family permease